MTSRDAKCPTMANQDDIIPIDHKRPVAQASNGSGTPKGSSSKLGPSSSLMDYLFSIASQNRESNRMKSLLEDLSVSELASRATSLDGEGPNKKRRNLQSVPSDLSSFDSGASAPKRMRYRRRCSVTRFSLQAVTAIPTNRLLSEMVQAVAPIPSPSEQTDQEYSSRW